MADSYNELFGLGSHSEDASLVPWMPLQDDAANTVVDDIASNDDDGVLQGGENTEDANTTGPNSWLTAALNFDGNDYVDSMSAPVVGTGALTILQRLKTSSAATPVGVAWGNNAGAGEWLLFRVENGELWMRHNANTAGGGSGYNDGVWHNISWSKPANGGVTDWTCRADKSDVSLSTSGSTTLDFADAGMVLGRRNNTSSDFWVGDLSEFAVFSRELTSSEKDEWEDGPEPVNSVAPSVSGTETVGETLSVTNGTWGLDAPFSAGSNGTITYSYQWTRSDDATGTNEADISGATSSTYTLVAADEGKFIRCRVRASNDGGFDSAADTNSDFTGEIQPESGTSVVINQATEQDTAFGITFSKTRSLALSTEQDLAQPKTAERAHALALATERDLAQTMTASFGTPIGLATEQDLALQAASSKSLAIAQATEQDVAQAMTAERSRPIGQASEQDLSFAVTISTTTTIGQAAEQDLAFAAAWARTLPTGLATEQDLAFSITLPSTIGDVLRFTAESLSQPTFADESLGQPRLADESLIAGV